MLDSRVLRVFREVFEDDSLVVTDETTARDIPAWDSLAHVKLVIALEEEFDIKFTMSEISSWARVGDAKRILRARHGSG